MSDVAALEAEVKEFKHQLETVQASLQVDPDNEELQSLQTELEEFITLTETSIAELKPAAPAAKPAPARTTSSGKEESATPQPPVDTRREAPPPPPPSFAVNDDVLARWKSGDGSFYPARITSVTGSASNPVYLVSFKAYATVENLTSRDIRPVHASDNRKRKADGTPGSSASPSPAPSNVISAAADINPALASQARAEPTKATEASARPAKQQRKVKANRELEEGKNKWQDFATKSKGKVKGKFGKKESMFRTGDSFNARVGFVGSGQQMRKDPTRTRHTYQQTDDDGY
ncbi:hypothetical protein N7532_000794 [Penicillium argentinense]|uniref:Tudor domain-containing protein n=1 Tax=Penicillium argentinense TaxID=1131581 RepID=A0A9W9G5V5_9EURO|nr:uncharacterized protein N7532_000794 [Penicillium argentinense]KAJ5112749.1 hypothetical protein N7532_000794 [Penicillium argentinense]